MGTVFMRKQLLLERISVTNIQNSTTVRINILGSGLISEGDDRRPLDVFDINHLACFFTFFRKTFPTKLDS